LLNETHDYQRNRMLRRILQNLHKLAEREIPQ